MRSVIRKVAGLALLGAALASCKTLEYRDVQADFEQAVRTKADGLTDALAGNARYEQIRAKLTDQYISELDLRLRPNAYMIRAMCEWRTRAKDADGNSVVKTSVSAGVKIIDAQLPAEQGKRDDIVLHLVRALVIDTQEMDRWNQRGRKVDDAQMTEHEEAFKNAFALLDTAAARMSDKTTPPSIRDYYHFQRWRLFGNWAKLIVSIDAGSIAASRDSKIKHRRFVTDWSRSTSTAPLPALAIAEAAKISPESPLKQITR